MSLTTRRARTMESRLTQLAFDLISRFSRPRVLDYETPPEPREALPWRERLRRVDWPPPSAFVFATGVAICVAGVMLPPGSLGNLLAVLGASIVMATVHWWLRQPGW